MIPYVIRSKNGSVEGLVSPPIKTVTGVSYTVSPLLTKNDLKFATASYKLS